MENISAGLYVVALPIGNARDITLRALDTLNQVNTVLCEDTRVTKKFMLLYGIKSKLLSYNDHNATRIRAGIIQRLKLGERIALVSDAGTPLVNDPGYKLVVEAINCSIPIFSLPGPSAVINALLLAGLPTDRFMFAGYPPSKLKPRLKWLADFKTVQATIIFLESPRRLISSLQNMKQVFGNRNAAILREMTKIHEEIKRGTLADLANYFSASSPPKGEITVVIDRAENKELTNTKDIDELLRLMLENNSIRDAARVISSATNFNKRVVYARALQISKELCTVKPAD